MTLPKRSTRWLLAALLPLAACRSAPPAAAPTAAAPTAAGTAEHDIILRGGTIYDGRGGAPYVGDIAIDGDRIAAIGVLGSARGRQELDVAGRAVAPGFINMLSWADESLLVDGRSLSDLVQGVTLEVFGEGWSMGPLNAVMRAYLVERQQDLRYDVAWTTLGQYLEHLERRGVSTNVASFVGAETVRIHELGYEDRAATAAELDRMRELVRQAMLEGALGVGSSLPYVPAAFASTAELIALATVAAEQGGLYISHIRGEGDQLFESLDEFLAIVRAAGARGEVYHLKAAGKENWWKLDGAIARIESARAEGLAVTADIYPYHASSTGLTYVLPDWVQEGGHEQLVARLRDEEIRGQVLLEMEMIPPEDIVLVDFRNEALRHLTGKSLAQVAAMRGTSPEMTALDLIVEDDSRIGTVRFTMSEANVRKKMALPWVAFCSDSGSIAPEPPFTHSRPHPRAYGSFARILGKYVREERIVPLEEAIRRLTSFPAQNLALDRRGALATGFYADVVVFDPETIADRATFEAPHQLAVGVDHVFVNGTAVIRGGRHTGETPGRVVRGPGYRGEIR